jgi:hypothetical protein
MKTAKLRIGGLMRNDRLTDFAALSNSLRGARGHSADYWNMHHTTPCSAAERRRYRRHHKQVGGKATILGSSVHSCGRFLRAAFFEINPSLGIPLSAKLTVTHSGKPTEKFPADSRELLSRLF